MFNKKAPIIPDHIWEEQSIFKFLYAIVMIVWLIFASYIFTHYKVDFLTLKQNLALGFVYYFFFASMIALTPVWYQITLSKFTKLDNSNKAILSQYAKSETKERYDEMAEFLEKNGTIIPFRTMLPLAAIFWVLIFELYFLYAWIDPQTKALLWKFDWMQSAIQWVINHTNQESLFTFDVPNVPRSETWRATTLGILQTPAGNTLALVHLWFMFSYVIILVCFYKVLWRGLGIDRADPSQIHSVGGFIFCSFASILFWAAFVVNLHAFFVLGQFPVTKLATTTNVIMWFSHLKIYLAFPLFFLFSLKGFLGWYYFWKRIIFDGFFK